MSIDSQLAEMRSLAEREDLNVVCEKQESHSAKASGQRPVYNEMVNELREGKFNAILTWNPDRLSRNAGDLGSIVDLMDEHRLLHIRTFSQTFSNSPNEKFLLMILCSQAKLENDNKSINVKRGIRTKLNMGWRPGVAPLGYMNRSFGGVKDIIIDPERAPFIKQAFEKTAQGATGREIHRWFQEVGCTNRSGKALSLSQVFIILNTPFYYGRFEYPEGSGEWYTGKHEPLITKELYDQVHTGRADYKGQWGSKHFAFKDVISCGTCGCAITAEDKFKLLKDGSYKRFIYYHCTKKRDRNCPEKYMSEPEMQLQIRQYIMAHADEIEVSSEIQKRTAHHLRVMKYHLTQYGIDTEKLQPLASYADFVLGSSNSRLINELVEGLETKFVLRNGEIALA